MRSNTLNRVVIAGLVAGIFFPVAKELERPVRETVTPGVLKQVVWAGANLKSFSQASEALHVLADITLSAKRIRRITEQVGQDRLGEREQQVAEFQRKPLMERIASPGEIDSPDVGVVMMDGGRYQRRDHFQEDGYEGSHWKEDKVGIVLGMQSPVHDLDPHPEFPSWLASADGIAEIASLGTLAEENAAFSPEDSWPRETAEASPPWEELSPKRLSREVIASSQCGEEFGHHLEYAAWQHGVVDAPRMAFVADGASVNWTIHQAHFSQMTGILDLMHALSYAFKAAKAFGDCATYRRYATWIWQGNVAQVIEELKPHLPPPEADSPDPAPADPLDPITRAITYFTNHRQHMNYPEYRKQGLPLTSSPIESTIKEINIRVKGSEKFFRKDTGETLLQLRADSLCDSQPLTTFWTAWLKNQTGANTYRTQAT